jgi:hypothetical protein
MRKVLLIASLLVSAGAQAQAQTAPEPGPRKVRMPSAPPPRLEGRCAVVPMEADVAVPVVAVTVNGNGPYRFLIDTGAPGHGRIRANIAATIGLPVTGERLERGPAGPVPRRQFGVERLGVGDIGFGGLQLGEMPDMGGRDPGFDGLLGLDLFQQLRVTFDFGARRLGLGTAPQPPELPFEREGAPTLTLAINGRPQRVHLDTGNRVAALFLAEADARALPLTGEPVSRGRARTPFGEYDVMEAPTSAAVTLGGVRLPVTSVAWPAALPPGNLGSKGLAGMALTIDVAAGRVGVTPSGKPLACPA